MLNQDKTIDLEMKKKIYSIFHIYIKTQFISWQQI